MPRTARVHPDDLFHPEAKGILLQRLGSIAPDSERRWGRMTAPPMVCHLGDTFRVATGERPAQPIGGMLEHTLMRWIALHTPLPWPKGKIRSAAELDQEVAGTRPSDFRQDVTELERLIERFAASERGEMEGREHPFFGRLSAQEWGCFAYRHTDHHLRQFGA